MPARTGAQAQMAHQLERGTPDFGTPSTPGEQIDAIHARRDHRWLQKTGWSPMQIQAGLLQRLSEEPEGTREEMARAAVSSRIAYHPDLDDGESRYVHEHEQHLGPSTRQRENADRVAASPEGRRRQADSDEGLLSQLEDHRRELVGHADEVESWIARSPAGPHRDSLEQKHAGFMRIIRQLDSEANLARERLDEYSNGY